jgi:hypothetical protein
MVSLPPRAAFVVGMKRSGTSLVKALLEGHPQVMALPRETKTFRWREAADPVAAFLERSRFGTLIPPDSPDRARFVGALRERLAGPATAAEAVRAAAEAVAVVRPPAETAEVWLEKTPGHLHDLHELLAAFGPETRFVGTIRDPRAQLASRRLRRKGKRPVAAVRFAGKWARDEERLRYLEQTVPALLVVRYEDVVLETRETMARVAEHLGLDWDEGLLTPVRDDGVWRGNSSYRSKRAGVATDSLERYVDELPEEDIRTLESCLRPRMERRGYAIRSSPPRRPARRLLLESRARWEVWRQRR